MKAYLVIIVFLLFKLTFAQEKEKIKPGTPINSGFVFIDGKYIEPPYKVKRKGLTIYLNEYPIITKTVIKKNPYAYNHPLVIPDCCIDVNSGLDVLFNCKDPYEGLPLLTAISRYFYGKYEFSVAVDSIKNFIRKLPNIKKFEDKGDYCYIEAYNGDHQNLAIGCCNAKRNSLRWGPNGKGIKKKEIIISLDDDVEYFQKRLLQNNILFVFSNESNKNNNLKNIFSDSDIINSIISNESFSVNKKIDTLIYVLRLNVNYKEKIKLVIDNFLTNKKLIERVKKININKNDNKKYNNENSKNSGNILNNQSDFKYKDKDFPAFSPSSNKIFGWCGNMFENEFNMFLDKEIYNIEQYTSGYGYNNSPSETFYDNSPCDDDFGNCTYENFINMRNAGILYFSGHGNILGEFLVYATNQATLQNWCENDPNIQIIHLNPDDIDNWDSNTDCWAAMATPQWFEINWKPYTTLYKTIVVLSSCYSGTGIIEHVGGGIAFGYLETTQWGTIFQPGIRLNNEQLFKRMNGLIGAGQYREAVSAYNNMSNHYHGFTFSSNYPITLCPAPKSKYPEDNATVGLQGSGWFEVDTYCDASIPINDQDFNNSPIAFEWTNPGLSITNVHWDDPDGDGLSNKIVFNWHSTSNNIVTVKINHNYWRSAPYINNGYHLLDYNKVTPNSEDGQYSFIVSNTIPSQPPVADFTYTISGNTVYFQDQSTNTPTSWHWDFGDGQSSTLPNVSHTYANSGTYNVTLTVSNSYGSSSKTKLVSINTPQTVTVWGVVENADDFSPIAGATVSCDCGSTTTTNLNGQYSLQVPYNVSNCGYIRASAPGFQISSPCSCNNLISNKNCDFNLFPINLYIYTQGNVHSVGLGFTINFYSSYTNGQAYYWEIFDNNNNLIFFQNTFSWSLSYTFFNEGTFKIRVTVDNMTSPFYDIVVKKLDCKCLSLSIGSTCHVVKTNQPVTFWNIGFVPDDIKNNKCLESSSLASCYAPTGRRWITAYGTPYEYKTNIYPWGGTNPPDPWYYTTSFSHGGKYSIKYEIIAERVVYGDFLHPHPECWSAHSVYNFIFNDPQNNCECYGEVIVVDCNAYSSCNFFGCPNSIPGWDELGHFHRWSGTFYLNQQANPYINTHDLILSACNEIVLDDGFIADGTHEFIAEIEDFNCHPDKFEQYINSFQQNDSVQSKWEEDNYISIYPNPFINEIYVLSSEKNIQSIQVYNILGELVFNDNFYSKRCKIDTSSLNEGIYIIEIEVDNIFYRVKLIKQSKL